MTPRQYEEAVAAHFRAMGYRAELTPEHNDYGVDVFAWRGTDKLAIQAKMYGATARKVNREMVMQLHGAKDFFDCTKAVMVTSGDVLDSAWEVAKKLSIEMLTLAPEQLRKSEDRDSHEDRFGRIWRKYIMPLEGRAICRSSGSSNTIVKVDWGGIERITSNGRRQRIPIEVFELAINHLLKHGFVSRALINEEYAKRALSGIVLVLSQVPLFEHVSNPEGLRLKAAVGD